MAWCQGRGEPNPCHRETRLITGDYRIASVQPLTNWCCRSTFCAAQLGCFDPFADCKDNIGWACCNAPRAWRLRRGGAVPDPSLAFSRVLYLRKVAREIVPVPL